MAGFCFDSNCVAGSDNISATSAALLFYTIGVTVDPAGNLYIPDGFLRVPELGRLRKVSNGVISTVAGTLGVSGDNGPAINAQLDLPTGITLDSAGELYISDTANNLVRKVSNGQIITTIAGNRRAGFDGGSSLYRPRGLALDPTRGLYIADGGGIRRLVNGSASVLLGPSDVRGVIAGLALDTVGNLYVADLTGNRVLRVSAAGITIEAGEGAFGFSGDGGPAVNARLAGPSGIALDIAGNLYITDLGNQRIRKVSKGIITTVAGNGATGFSGDNGPAIEAQLNLSVLGCPNNRCDVQAFAGIAVDTAGDLYFADSGNHRVRRVSNGVISTIAGNGSAGFGGDNGPASDALLDVPSGVAVDAAGKVYFADSGNGRIRMLASACTAVVSPVLIHAGQAGGDFPIVIQTGEACPFNISVLPGWITLGGRPGVLGPGAFTLTIAPNSGAERMVDLIIDGVSVHVTQASAGGFGPFVSSAANAFGGSRTIAPNTWVEIKGSTLSPGFTRTWQESDFINGRMPTVLDGVSVELNGKSAYVFYISPTQINILTPLDLPVGPILGVVKVYDATSPVFFAQSQSVSPSLFAYNGGPYVVAVHADYTRIGPPNLFPGLTTPAKPGESVVIFANGFGGVSMPIAVGSVSQSGNLPVMPEVKIGGVAVSVQFAGLVSPGLYQFNVIVPASLPDGDNSILVTYNGASTQPGTFLTIQK